MTLTRYLWVPVACALWIPAPASAQAATLVATERLSVEEAVQRALAHAPRLAEARARAAAADATVSARHALSKPTVSAVSSVTRTNHVDEFGIPQSNGTTRVIFPDIPSNYRARAEASLPIYTSGRIDALVAAAEADKRATSADEQQAAADVALETRTAYWMLVLASERVTVLERTLQRADAQLSDVRARVDAGFLPPNDVLSAQALRARQQVQLIQAQNDAALASMQLARLVGADSLQMFAPTTPIGEASADAIRLAAEPLAALVSRANGARPERQAMLERRSALEAAAEASAAATRPQVGAFAAVEPARPNARFVPRADVWNTSWDLAINVSWALWDGGRSRADRAAAMAQASAVEHRVQDFDAMVAVEVRQRLLELASGRAALAAAGEAVLAATEARRVVGERFAAGVATNTDVLESEVAQLEAELERARLATNLRIGEARLVRAVGGR